EHAFNYALSQFNLPHLDSQKYKLLLGKGRRNLVESIVSEFFENNNEEIIEKFISYFNYYYEIHMFDNTKPFDGILDTLDYLNNNNVTTAILSNKPHDFTLSLASRFFGNKVKKVYGLQDGYEAKPDPVSLLEIINELGLKNNECIYIGDTEIDIQVSKNAKVKSLGVLWGFRTASILEGEGADYIASTIDELKEIIMNN
ncbi:MAG: HAD family hydrolase, partial [Sedimentibacter sp.]